jgi:hypothetical protein
MTIYREIIGWPECRWKARRSHEGALEKDCRKTEGAGIERSGNIGVTVCANRTVRRSSAEQRRNSKITWDALKINLLLIANEKKM